MLRPLAWVAISTGLAFGQAHSDKQAMTIAQLNQVVAGPAQREGDAALARTVSSQHLSERLTPATLSHLEEALRAGPQTQAALRLLADESAFLEPPAGEIPDKPAPSAPEQQAMLNAAVNFVAVTMRRLPDFFATRVTDSFDDAPTVVTHSGWSPAEPIHPDGTFHQTITFRDGREVVGQRSSVKGGSDGSGPPGLTSTGEFGPLLATILRDSSHGTVGWSHWEPTGNTMAAVFHYAVPEAASHYEVDYCCVKSREDPTAYAPGGTPNAYHGRPAYHGELALDPMTGTILRVTLVAELKASDPIHQAGVAIDYAPVTIEGDKSYICPVHSLALSVAETYGAGENGARQLTRVNEVSFTGYHRFGSTIRVINPAGQP